MNLRAVKGMNDILPGECERWQRLERSFCSMVELYRFREIRTPIVEPTALFVRSIGEVTDIVEKEMYSFERHGDSLTLRPEGTASAARAYLEHSVHARESVSRWYYIGPMFRAETPQKGRYRQFYQAGCEVFGEAGPLVDAEMIDMLVRLLRELSIPDVTAQINSLGGAGSRARYRDALVDYLTPRKAELSEESQRRLLRSPLRILDSKDPRDAAVLERAPAIVDLLDDDDRKHFDGLCRLLDRMNTPYRVNPRLVRGFDYYSRTLFELTSMSGDLGSQNAVGGGGRYDHMLRDLGGTDLPAIGFALGLERLLLAMPKQEAPATPHPLVFVAPIGEAAMGEAVVLAVELRALGIPAEVDGRQASLKAMLRRANSVGATHCVLFGESELSQGLVQVKDLVAHSQENLPRGSVAQTLADRLRSSQKSGGA